MDKKKIITISLFSIFLLLGAILSIAYAYFKASVSNIESSSTISIESGKMSITYEGNTSAITASNIIPNWSTTKKFTLVGINDTKANNVNTDNNMYYKIGIVVDNNTFSEGSLTYTLNKDSSSSSNGQMADSKTGTIPSSGTKFIATGYFSETSTEVSHIYNLTIAFPDTGEDQSDDQGASFACHVTVEQSEAPKYVATTLLKLYSSKIKTNGVTEDGLEIENTKEENLRYTGASPKNYISFNDETWRIIGTFEIYNTETKQNEKLTKIIREESLGLYAWDTTESTINSGYGINEWSQSKLMTELNTDYLDSTKTGTTTWYNFSNNAKTATYDYSKNIKSTYLPAIATVRWNLGGLSATASVLNTYNSERGTTHVANPSDKITRKDYWDGKVGLIYPSDYGYSTTNASCRTSMASTSCSKDNWLFNSAYQWTLTSNSSDVNHVWEIGSTGRANYSYASYSRGVRPVLYLKSEVIFTDGDGTSTNPYKISIGEE